MTGIETEVEQLFEKQLGELLPGFPVYRLKSASVERADRFALVETALLKPEGPGIPLYQLQFAIHVGTRRVGDRADPDELDLDEAYERIRANYAQPKRQYKIRDGWFIVGMVAGDPERNESDTHAVRVLQYTLFIINKEG